MDEYDDGGFDDIISEYSAEGFFSDAEESELNYEEDDDNNNTEGQDQPISLHNQTKISYIEGDDRRCPRFMTKYEYTYAIAYRAEQIENGADVHPEVRKLSHLTHSLDIAKYELDHYTLDFPNYILRPILDTATRKIYEIWYIKELIIPRDLLCITPQYSSVTKINSNCKNDKRIEFDIKARSFVSLKHYT